MKIYARAYSMWKYWRKEFGARDLTIINLWLRDSMTDSIGIMILNFGLRITIRTNKQQLEHEASLKRLAKTLGRVEICLKKSKPSGKKKNKTKSSRKR